MQTNIPNAMTLAGPTVIEPIQGQCNRPVYPPMGPFKRIAPPLATHHETTHAFSNRDLVLARVPMLPPSLAVLSGFHGSGRGGGIVIVYVEMFFA